jgi:uncharacterized protein (TIGR02722 family)
MTKKNIAILATVGMIMTGCATTPVYTDGSHSKDAKPKSLGIEHNDLQKAAGEAIESMVNSGALNKRDGSRYVMMISDIINDTTQRFDIDQLIKKIRIGLLQSGKVVVTTAVRAGGAEDKASYDVRKLANDKHFNKATVAKEGTMIAPELSLSGKIIQRNTKTVDDKQQVDYYFQLTVTDINTGLAFWEGETVVGKLGSDKSVSW